MLHRTQLIDQVIQYRTEKHFACIPYREWTKDTIILISKNSSHQQFLKRGAVRDEIELTPDMHGVEVSEVGILSTPD